MKNINKKIIVSTLALAMGATLAGSISGTVAWFQYSTRAQAAYIGTSAHCSEMLEVKVGNSDWLTDLNSTLMNSKKVGGTVMEPITTGSIANNAAVGTFYKNPIYQIADQANWGTATSDNFVQFNLSFHVKDVNGGEAAYLSGHHLYLTDLTIVDESTPHDLYKAVRVHFATSSKNALFAKDGTTAATVVTNTSGKLDLNNNGVLDRVEGYEWDTSRADVIYGNGTQTAHNASGTGVLANDSNPNSINAGTAGDLGEIPANEAGLAVTVTIWLEGWTPLSEKPEGNATGDANGSAIWDAATYINKAFKVGMRFGTEVHSAH